MILDIRAGFGDFYNYKLFKFPDNSIKFELKTSATITKVIVTLRTNDDLISLMMVKDVLDRKGMNPELYITYMMYQQDDRLFKDSESFGLRLVSEFINHQNWKKVSIFNPHSDKIEFINNVNTISNSTLIMEALDSIKEVSKNTEPTWIIPDSGAFKTQFKQIDGLGHKNFITCLKSRDHLTGDIKTIVPIEDLKGQDCFIVDDICLGGRTFIAIAEELKKKNCGKLYLIVSHGIFNHGLEELINHFDVIYTTNSICTLRQTDILRIFEL